jgi:hypothetical protein
MMRKQSYILCAITTIMFLFLIIYLVTRRIVKKSPFQTSYVENFTPGIRKLVRPHLRNARVATEEYREYFTDKTNQGLKMLGLQFI